MTSSILQGKSIKAMADDLQTRITDMSRTSAIRTARTAVTGAQNAGRMDSYAAAEKMGIRLKKQWLATLDNRTRHSHAVLDGETQENDKPFSNGCMFPGDPNGTPAETYNCRCTLISALDGVTAKGQRWARDPVTGESVLIEDMTYAEWAGWKQKEMTRRKTAEDGHEIIDQPTYNKLTRKFVKSGGVIIRREEAAKHLDLIGAEASYITGSGVAFIRDDASVSAVLEEMFHAQQDKSGTFGVEVTQKIKILREIEAQEYLIAVASKYKIPSKKTGNTFKVLNYYKLELERLESGEQ